MVSYFITQSSINQRFYFLALPEQDFSETALIEDHSVVLHRSTRSLDNLFNIAAVVTVLLEVGINVFYFLYNLSISNYYGVIVYLATAVIAVVKFLFF